MASSIGIKIANGEFYPIMEENSSIKKRLILTTVHNNQPSVQIDLYRSVRSVMTDAQYIGSLVVENIKPKPKGEPNIEMVVSSNKNGEIVADAIDLDTNAGGEHYVLTVSLKSLDETTRGGMEIPDFELENNEEPPSGLYQHAKKINQKKSRSALPLVIIIALILILGIVALWYFLFGGKEYIDSNGNTPIIQVTWSNPLPALAKQPEPVRQPEPVSQPEPVKQPEPVQPKSVATTVEEPPPVIQAPAAPPPPRPQTQTSRRRPPPPVASYKVPATIPRDGVDYRIRYGDTLWDISEAFYRNPWLYPRIARHNNIRNPDLIISGRTIRIPPRN